MTAQVIPIEHGRRLDDALLDDVAGLAEGAEVRFHPSMPAYAQRLLAQLGVRVIFDPTVPPGESW